MKSKVTDKVTDKVEEEWLLAVPGVPELPAKIVGLTLRPFTLGHELLLQKYSLTAALQPIGEAELATCFHHLIWAALICSLDPVKAERQLHSWRLKVLCAIWSKLLRRVDLAAELEAFDRYREAAYWFPDCRVPVGEPEMASPWPLRLLAFLMSAFHWPEEKALRTPLRWANALYAAHAEMRNEIRLTGAAEEAILDKLREAEAKPEMWDF